MSQITLSSQATRRKDDPLAPSLERLRQALSAAMSGHERVWVETLQEILAQMEPALRQHRAGTKADGGALAEVDETRPTLARQADEVRSDHDELLGQVVALNRQVQLATAAFSDGATSGADAGFVAIRQQAEKILDGLQENRATETKLVQESVNTDIGGGD
jgi:hypothetical protein